MQRFKLPQEYIKEYEEMFGEPPPDVGIREDPNERLDAIIEAIDSGQKMPPDDPLDPRIDY